MELEYRTMEEESMATTTTSPMLSTQTEDLLAHLPMSGATEYRRGETIYGPDQLSKCIYLVVKGKVGISQISDNGAEVLLEIVRPEELFGESAFLGLPRRSERATAIERVTVMTWPVSEMESLIMKRPRLAVAMLQVLAQRNAEFSSRIGSFATDGVERRLARSLLRLSDRLGHPEDDGSVGMMPFTHEMLSRYIGSTREVVTYYMIRFRKKGYVNYSRSGIQLYRDVLKSALNGRSGQLAD